AGPTFAGPAGDRGWLSEVCGEDLGLVWSGGSVANVAFSVAYLMGLNPIIFIGQDLAYGDGCTHSRLLEHQEPADWEKREGFIPVEGNLGGIVYTKSTWLSFREWFERVFAAVQDRTIINATEGGARIRGTLVMTLREALRDYVAPLPPRPFREEIRDIYLEHQERGLRARRERLTDYLEKAVRSLRRARKCCAGGAALAENLRKRCLKGQLGPGAQRLASRLDGVEERLNRLKRATLGANVLFGQVDLELGTVSGEVQGELKEQVLTALEAAFLYYARQAQVLERVIPVAQEVLERLREEQRVAGCSTAR
ncbi:MAG: motility associated factor glycosyltransferase family protein, partial [Firmicutes bacterium]|nr:motility associated factor glycosyltransferase family protein [Bacillota bacterium]